MKLTAMSIRSPKNDFTEENLLPCTNGKALVRQGVSVFIQKCFLN